MNYCNKCGTKLDENKTCPKCEATNVSYNNVPYEVDDGSIGWGILGFCFPIVGLILYCVWLSTKPLSAKMAGKGALISVIVGVALAIVLIIIAAIAFNINSNIIYY